MCHFLTLLMQYCCDYLDGLHCIAQVVGLQSSENWKVRANTNVVILKSVVGDQDFPNLSFNYSPHLIIFGKRILSLSLYHLSCIIDEILPLLSTLHLAFFCTIVALQKILSVIC